MPEEGIAEAPELQDKPDEQVETSEETTSEPDYRSQYEELRSKFNERDAEIGETRQLRELAEELGYTPAELAQAIRENSQTEEEEEAPEYEDPNQKLQERIDRLEAEREEEKARDAFMGMVEDVEGAESLKIPQPFLDHMWQQAVNKGRMPKDVFKEDWPALVEAASAYDSKRKENEVAKKRAARPPAGSPGSREEDLSDEDTRLAAVARAIEESRDSEA